mmetsp:Transcript_16925/g.43123  ORF Transcript_16925/g.43123 Transcript_16925/m.43123 type:complete len:242 (+) Transcript_16925:299-1024(+)
MRPLCRAMPSTAEMCSRPRRAASEDSRVEPTCPCSDVTPSCHACLSRFRFESKLSKSACSSRSEASSCRPMPWTTWSRLFMADCVSLTNVCISDCMCCNVRTSSPTLPLTSFIKLAVKAAILLAAALLSALVSTAIFSTRSRRPSQDVCSSAVFSCTRSCFLEISCTSTSNLRTRPRSAMTSNSLVVALRICMSSRRRLGGDTSSGSCGPQMSSASACSSALTSLIEIFMLAASLAINSLF